MKILLISGSSRPDSQNVRLLNGLPERFRKHKFQLFDISELPLFIDKGDGIDYPKVAVEWRRAVEVAGLMVICTPEYIHNMPAALKNALEWITQSGELAFKKVLPITYTPSPPRGEKAMQSLLWSLKALDAKIIGQLDLYQSDEDTVALLDSVIEEILSNSGVD